MGRPMRIEYPGAFYHVTSRGNEKKDIFKSEADREIRGGVSRLVPYEQPFPPYVGDPPENLSRIMKHINGSYTNYFNIKRKRAGHLLQGRYKAILVEADTYAAELSRYIHHPPEPRQGKDGLLSGGISVEQGHKGQAYAFDKPFKNGEI